MAESLAASFMECILAIEWDVLIAPAMLRLGGVANAGGGTEPSFVMLRAVKSGSEVEIGMLLRTDERLLLVPECTLS